MKNSSLCVKSRNHKCVYLSWVCGFEMELFIIFLLLMLEQPHFLLSCYMLSYVVHDVRSSIIHANLGWCAQNRSSSLASSFIKELCKRCWNEHKLELHKCRPKASKKSGPTISFPAVDKYNSRISHISLVIWHKPQLETIKNSESYKAVYQSCLCGLDF